MVPGLLKVDVGELFLGASFGALDSNAPPQFLFDIDRHFLLSGIDHNFTRIHDLLSWTPSSRVQHFLNARARINEVCLSPLKNIHDIASFFD